MTTSTPTARVPGFPIDAFFAHRWSPRAFTDETIDVETLNRFFEAARWAPSAFNAQPWRFVFGRRDTPAWNPLFDALSPYNQTWAARAAALVLVVSREAFQQPGKTELTPVGSHVFDAGAAWAQFALQASLAGWHTHGMAGFDKDKLRAALGVPADYHLHAVIAIGKIGDKASLPEALQGREVPSQRRPITELVAEGRFDFDRA